MRIATPLALLLACAPAPPPAPERPAPEPPAPRHTTPDPLLELVEAWHPLDPAIADASPIWLVTRYEPGTYPCSPGPDGSLDMLVQDRFRVLQVVRGAVTAPGVDLDLHALRGRGSPRAYAEGRRYLLFLRPGPRAQAALADPAQFSGPDDRLGLDDVLGVIDLDESRAETEAEATPATRIDPRWDPPSWDAARSAAAPEPARQRALAAALQAVILRPRAPLADVRSWLGPPDEQALGPGRARRDQYFLAHPAYTTPVHGAIYGDLRLRYDAELELRGAELMYLRWRVDPREQASVALTPEEHQALGLPHFALEFAAAR